MGYERKRGKLGDLNALLRGRSNGQFSRVVGDTTILGQVKYVITLDADTQLPRDAARLLVGAMTHPLNRARYDEHEPARDRRIRHPAAARGGQPSRRKPVAGTRGSGPASRASTPIPASCPTSTRTCSAKGPSSARASTTWMRSTWPSADAFPRTGSSATTCSKAATRAPGC